MRISFWTALVMMALAWSGFSSGTARADNPWVVYPGGDGPGKGKHIVFLSGDEEYRSEEGLPQLARILAKHYGFTCTVLFSVNDKGEIDPKHLTNIPGLQALDSADLAVILLRFRELPEDQMKHIDDFLKAGKPVIGMRTATHAFNKIKGTYEKYSNDYSGPEKEWAGGFGRLVLGEKWVSHWASHRNESTHGVFAPTGKGSPFLNGITDGEIWGSTDVYEAHPPADAQIILLGQVCKRVAAADKGEIAKDKNFMLRPNDVPLAGADDPKKRNDPMMPIAWTKPYQIPGGKQGRSFCTTMGASCDLENEGLRRLLVNASFELLGMKVPEKADVAIVGAYNPTAFGNGGHTKGVKPADLQKTD